MGIASASPPAPPMALTDRLVRPPVLAAVLAFLAITPVAAGQGGYFPVAWGWMGLAYAWVGAIALALRREIRLSTAELAMVAGGLLVVLWTFVTLLWTSNTTDTVLVAEHVLAYLAFAAAMVVACERRSAIGVLVGTWAAITVVSLYSLATHLGPAVFGLYLDPLGPGRLFQPIGYWNALGIFCGMGIALALGLVDRPGQIVLRAVAAASIAPLAATLYFTFSRGSWVALAIGIAWVVALNPHRLRYFLTTLLVLPFPALAVGYASSFSELTAETVHPAEVAAAGSRAALVIGGASVVAALIAGGLATIQSRVVVPRRARQGFGGFLIVVGLAGAVGSAAYYGSPISRADDLYHSLTAAPETVAPSSSLNKRLADASLNGRQDQWQTALDDFQTHPIIGGGAGTYGGYWMAHRKVTVFVVNAHSLYLETLAEEGVLGLSAVLLFLSPAVIVGLRFRSSPEVSVASGAYVAYLVHAGVDWDWQVSAVTITALAIGVAALVAARQPGSRPLSRAARGATIAGFVVIAVLGVLGLIANRALSNGAAALAHGDVGAALSNARQANRFAPWSDTPDILAGQAQLKAKRRVAARASFASAAQKEPADWVAWQWLARATTGVAHARAVARLRVLDPRYDFANGRP